MLLVFTEKMSERQPIAESSRFHRTFKPYSRHLRNAMNSREASFLFLSTISVFRQRRRYDDEATISEETMCISQELFSKIRVITNLREYHNT